MDRQIEAMGKTLQTLRYIGARTLQRLIDEAEEKKENAENLRELIHWTNLWIDISTLHIHDFCYQTMPMYRMIADEIDERLRPRFDRQTLNRPVRIKSNEELRQLFQTPWPSSPDSPA